MKCGNCGFENKDGAKFCTRCGVNLAEAIPAPAATVSAAPIAPRKKSGAGKWLLIVFLCIVIFGGIAAAGFFVGLPAFGYLSAVNLENNGEYTKAAEAFDELRGFTFGEIIFDADDRADECMYLAAEELADGGNFDGAIEILEDLDNYPGAEEKIEEYRLAAMEEEAVEPNSLDEIVPPYTMITYEVDSEYPSAVDMETTTEILRERLFMMEFFGAVVNQIEATQIEVKIPNIPNTTNIETVSEELGTTAFLTFQDESGNILLDGSSIAQAETGQQITTFGQEAVYVVNITFTSEGAELFAEATASNIGKPLYIFLDDNIISMPTVNAVIPDGKCYIEGDFNADSAEYLAKMINTGALPFRLNVLSVEKISD